jgi:hypothetical protein
VAQVFAQLRLSKHSAEALPVESIKSRWSAIQRNVQKFNGCYLAMVRVMPTGSSPDGLIRTATGMDNGTHMQNEMDHCGTQFKMLEAWKVLRSSPKFSGGLTQVSCAVYEDGDSPAPEACNIESDHGSPNSTDLAGEYKADTDTKHEKSELGSSGRSVGRERPKNRKGNIESR